MGWSQNCGVPPSTHTYMLAKHNIYPGRFILFENQRVFTLATLAGFNTQTGNMQQFCF